MRRYLSLMLVAIFAIALSFGVIGCKKADAPGDEAVQEEQAPAEEGAAAEQQQEAAPAAEEGAAK